MLAGAVPRIRIPALPASLSKTGHLPLLAGLSLTRIIGWGSTYYAPAVLAPALSRDLGLSSSIIFGGVTLLLLTGAALAPAVGRELDRSGTRTALCLGTIICALGLGLIALAQGPVSYLASWIVIGIGHALMLANVGSVTVAQVLGSQARRAIGLMMLVTGLAPSVFWPLTSLLLEAQGWRATLVIYAALHLVVSLPIHALVPRGRVGPHVASEADADLAGQRGRLPQAARREGFWLVALAFSASGLVSWGLPLNLISLFRQSGLSEAEAVWIATLGGPATLAARTIDAMLGEKLPVEKVALVGLMVGPLLCFSLTFVHLTVAVGAAFVVLFSAALGVIAVARATLPLSLFGRTGFATMMGKLTVPQNLAFAAAPLLFAVMMERAGPVPTLFASAAIQSIGFVAMLLLVRMLARPAVMDRP